MSRYKDTRKIELNAIRDWIGKGESVLDLGCGRGILLSELVREKNVYAVGVDLDFNKILKAIKRDINVLNCDILDALKSFDDQSFDWIICSRTLPELGSPETVIKEALRVSKRVAVGFINYAYWLNRLSLLLKGSRVVNEVFPSKWYESFPTNDISIDSFKEFCKSNDITINRSHFLRGNWEEACNFMPNLFAGYAIFEISSDKENFKHI